MVRKFVVTSPNCRRYTNVWHTPNANMWSQNFKRKTSEMRQYGQTTPSPTFTKEAPHFLSAGNAASRSRCHNGWVRHPLRVGKTPSVGGENENSWGCPLESKMPPHDEIQVKNRYYTDCTSHLDIVSHTDKNRFFECTVRHLWQKLVAFGNSLKRFVWFVC